MHLIPTQDEVVDVVTPHRRDSRWTLRISEWTARHRVYSAAMAMRYYQHAKVLSVGLSRLLRANPEIRAIIPELSIVSPDTGGLPVAYGVCEALRAHQVYWADREDENSPMRFRQYWSRLLGKKL